MGSGQTTRASSPSSEHQILKKNIGGEFQSFSPLLLFPKSGCYTHPSPPRCWCSYCPLPTKLFLTKLATASLPLSLKKLPSSSPHHPPPHPSPARLTPTIVDLFMTPTVTRLLPLKSLLPPARTNKQNGSRNLNQLYIPPVPPASAKLFTLGRFPYIPAESICTVICSVI